LWVKPGELEQRVLEDIIWVRERYAFARKGEPTDEDITFFYDAGAFDDGEDTKENVSNQCSGDDKVNDDYEELRDTWSVTVQIEGNGNTDD
jgi:hypothetical protein